MMSLLFTVLCISLPFYEKADAVANGAVRFYRNSIADIGQAWSSGIVEIYLSEQWGNICDSDYDYAGIYRFGDDEANVVCHQLGFSGASSHSNTGIDASFGRDNAFAVIDDLNCYGGEYLTVTQCSYKTNIDSSCSDSYDAIVTCYTTRIWNSPSNGDIRLTGGTYSNQGLLEIYCNNTSWGTVCDEQFSESLAVVACDQLGYNYYADYNNQPQLQGDSSQSIWLRKFDSYCTSGVSCLTVCRGCPTKEVTSCTHSQDVTLECEYNSFYSNSYSDTDYYGTSYCAYYDDDYDFEGLSSAIIAAIIVGSVLSLVCCVLIITIPICIAVCIGFGVGAATNRSPRTTTVTTQPNVLPPQQIPVFVGGEDYKPAPTAFYPSQVPPTKPY